MALRLQHFNRLIRNYANAICNAKQKNFHQLIEKFLPTTLNLSDVENVEKFEAIIKSRKTSVNFETIKSLLAQLNHDPTQEKEKLILQLENELLKLPNQTHPACISYGDEPKELALFNKAPDDSKKYMEFSEIAKKLNLFRMDHLGNFSGHKSYYFVGSLARLEHALIQYAFDHLKLKDFNLISVPDILSADVIEGCGMKTSGDRTQVYRLKSSGKCLSGTSEMALAGLYKNKIFKEEDLPIKLTAVSRCFRAETSGLHEEKGIYRVHQFTKVEMFSICTKMQSEQMLESFKDIEIEIFKKFGIHFKLLDMPPCELGAPAYRKFDIEAWMPGRKMWGEISSCSNCTDYQAKRLGIQYETKTGDLEYAHTVNGTACAVPRLLIALLETFQESNGKIRIPDVLHKYLDNQTQISRQKQVPELKLVKHIDSPGIR